MATPATSNRRWRFEAIDMRAGLAIAAWRKPRTTVQQFSDEQAHALFFSPPHFEPQPLAYAGAAMRSGAFETGLYVDGGAAEVSFSTTEEVAEFLRRAHAGHSAGGGAAAPLPDAAPRLRQALRLPDSPMVQALQRHAEVFASAAAGIPDGASELFSWGEHTQRRDERWVGTPQAQAGDAAALCAAALALIDEALHRMPAPQDAAWPAWYEAVRALTALLAALGLARQMLDPANADALGAILVRSRLLEDGDAPARLQLGRALLFGPGIPQPGSGAELRALLQQLGQPDSWSAAPPPRPDATVDTLMRLPLPQALHALLPDGAAGAASLHDLLKRMVAAPQAACAHPAQLPLALCLLLFAAACMAQGAGPAGSALRAAEQGYVWLVANLPRRVYAASHEALLAGQRPA